MGLADPGQLLLQFLHRLPALPGVFAKSTGDQRFQARRKPGRELAQGWRLVAQQGRQQLQAVLAAKCLPAGDHFVQEAAEREDVGARIHFLPLRLLRRHVGHGAENGAFLGQNGPRRGGHCGSGRRGGGVGSFRGRDRLGKLGKAEIEQLDLPLLAHHDVLWLQIPVDDAAGMRLRQRIDNLGAPGQDPLQRQAALPQHRAQRPAGDVLHDDEKLAVGFANVMDGDDVGMIDCRCRLRLLDETPAPPGIGHGGDGQNFDGDRPVEVRIHGLVDNAHASSAQPFLDPVVSQPLAGIHIHSDYAPRSPARKERSPGPSTLSGCGSAFTLSPF